MKKLNILIVAALTAVSGSAMAMGFTVEQGKNFTNLNMEMGKSSSGLYAESHWLKNTDDGSQTGGVGAGYNLEVGPVMLNAGAKAIYLGPKKGDNGVAFPVGGGVKRGPDRQHPRVWRRVCRAGRPEQQRKKLCRSERRRKLVPDWSSDVESGLPSRER